MNRLVDEIKNRYAVTALTLMLVFTMWSLNTQFAQSEPAVVITDQMCGFFDGNGNLYFTTDSHAVSTPSVAGDTVLTCKGDNVPNSTGNVVTYDADNNPFAPPHVWCTDGFGDMTLDWWEVVSPSGHAILQCHYHG